MSEVSFNIRFVSIELVSKSILEPPPDLQEKESFIFNFLVDLKVVPEHKTAAAIASTSILLQKDNKELANFKIYCVFEFPDFDTIFTKMEDNKYDTPVELEIILKSTGLSTIRGIIASEVKGTYLQGAVLPLIDMNALVRNQRKKTEEEKVR